MSGTLPGLHTFVSGINLTKWKACSHSKMYYPKTASVFNLVFFPIVFLTIWHGILVCLFVCGLPPPPRMLAPRGEVLFGSQLYPWYRNSAQMHYVFSGNTG